MKQKVRLCAALWVCFLAFSTTIGSTFSLGEAKSDEQKRAQFLRSTLPESIQAFLARSRQFYLLSLESDDEDSPRKGKRTFRGWKVLGGVAIRDHRQRERLLRAFYDGVAATAHAPGEPSPAKACFAPRHGLRAVEGNKALDIVICFECWQFYVYAGKTETGSTVAAAPQPLFDRALKNAGVPLSAK